MSKILKTAFLLLATVGIVDQAQAQPQSGPGGGPMMRMIDRIDTNGDGKITLDEYTNFAQERWKRIAKGADTVKVADLRPMQQNAFAGITPAADGTVSKDAYSASIAAKFKAADSNGDGTLDQAEMMAAMPMHRPAAN